MSDVPYTVKNYLLLPLCDKVERVRLWLVGLQSWTEAEPRSRRIQRKYYSWLYLEKQLSETLENSQPFQLFDARVLNKRRDPSIACSDHLLRHPVPLDHAVFRLLSALCDHLEFAIFLHSPFTLLRCRKRKRDTCKKLLLQKTRAQPFFAERSKKMKYLWWKE